MATFGAAGHGWGLAAFYYLGFPLSYVSLLVEDATNSGELAMGTCLLAGIVQSALLGYIVQRLFRAIRK